MNLVNLWIVNICMFVFVCMRENECKCVKLLLVVFYVEKSLMNNYVVVKSKSIILYNIEMKKLCCW